MIKFTFDFWKASFHVSMKGNAGLSIFLLGREVDRQNSKNDSDDETIRLNAVTSGDSMEDQYIDAII